MFGKFEKCVGWIKMVQKFGMAHIFPHFPLWNVWNVWKMCWLDKNGIKGLGILQTTVSL